MARRDGTPRTKFTLDHTTGKGGDPTPRREEARAHFLGELETLRRRGSFGEPFAEGIEVVEKHEILLMAAESRRHPAGGTA